MNESTLAKLPNDLLLKRNTLPEKPVLSALAGDRIYLKPLVVDRDAQLLFEISDGRPITLGERSIGPYDAGDLIWKYMFDGPFKDIIDFKASLQAQVNASNGLCLCVFDQATKKPVGVANLMNNWLAHLKIELGGIWYSPIVQRTGANTEATYLMLKCAFDLGYRRVEWKCDALNKRSCHSALRMGFKFEGIQESHFIVKGCNRDTAWFRMLDHEWPEAEKQFKTFLYKR